MVKAPPDNLGSRQRALNERVHEAVANQVHFNSVKDEPEANDIDKLYKIDVAAKYKNVDYILEILKSGDSLYTARALKKCPWLFEDEYSHVINPTYLQNNVFPFTSMKMKRKITKAAAARIRNAERAAEFFYFCMKEKMKGTALTCLLYTTEDFKLEQLHNNKEEPSIEALENKDIIYFRFFVGKSFNLLEALLEFMTYKENETARCFSNFFWESEEKYLALAEKYITRPWYDSIQPFDSKLSDIIMKKHKHRVLGKPKFYVNTVNTDILLKNSTSDDIKIYVTHLLPETAKEFWHKPYTDNFAEPRIFKSLPHDETYIFLKNYFAEHYSNSEFEMHPEFYKQHYYKYMTYEQREEWACRQLESDKQVLGVGRDYFFYKFINFTAAFKEIKRLICITNDAQTRNEMVQTLIVSARNERELETLFKYYSKRHMNELEEHKAKFLEIILSCHNVFELDEVSWSAFHTLMLAMDQFDTTDNGKKRNNNYKTVTLLYHILHDKKMPERLLKFLLDDFRLIWSTDHLQKITDKTKRQILSNFFFTFYMNIIDESKNKPFGNLTFNKIEQKWVRYFQNIDASMEMFNEHVKEKRECTEVYKRRNRGSYSEYHQDDYTVNQTWLLRDLKKDKRIVLSKISLEHYKFESYPKKINTFLKKIKVYFPDDVTKMYLDEFRSIFSNKEKLTENCEIVNAMKTGVYVILQLANIEVKTEFVKNFFPFDTTTDQDTSKPALDISHLRMQRDVCRFACFSRPPTPLTDMLEYMKEKNVKFCIRLWNMYLAVLPLPMCIHLVHCLLDAPVSRQKHAVKLAFSCFDTNSLQKLILNIWENTKNVTLRTIIYKALFKKVVDTKEKHLYDALKILTLDLNQDDEDGLFKITVSEVNELPEDFIGDYIIALWEAVEKFKDIEPNITRKRNVIIRLTDHIDQVNEEFTSRLVNEHVNVMLFENELHVTYSKRPIASLYEVKWLLIAHHIVCFACCNDQTEKVVQLLQSIIRKNIENWNDIAYDTHIHQKCCWDIFRNLKSVSLDEEYGDTENTIAIFQSMLNIVDTDLIIYDSYLLTWELQLMILTLNVMKKNRKNCNETDEIQVTITKIIKQYGEDLGKLVSWRVENDMFFMSFSERVTDKFCDYIKILLKLICVEIDSHCGWQNYLDSALITVAEALVEIQLSETYVHAIQLLPLNGEKCSSDEFQCLIDKFQRFANADVQLFLHQTLQKYCKKNVLSDTTAVDPSPCNIY